MPDPVIAINLLIVHDIQFQHYVMSDGFDSYMLSRTIRNKCVWYGL